MIPDRKGLPRIAAGLCSNQGVTRVRISFDSVTYAPPGTKRNARRVIERIERIEEIDGCARLRGAVQADLAAALVSC